MMEWKSGRRRDRKPGGSRRPWLTSVLWLAVLLMLAAALAACGSDGAGAQAPSSGSEDRESSGVSLDSADYEPISVQDLGSIPNFDYPWVVMLDVAAFLSGEVPQPVAYAVGMHDTRRILYDALEINDNDAEGVVLSSELGIPAKDVERATVIVVEGAHGYQLALQGDFDFRRIKETLRKARAWTKSEGPQDLYYFDGTRAVALLEDDGVVVAGYNTAVEQVYRELSRSSRQDPGISFSGEIGISTNSVGSVVFYQSEGLGRQEVVAIQGDFNFDQIRKDISEVGYFFEDGDVALELWRDIQNRGEIALVEYDGVVMMGSGIQPWLKPSYRRYDAIPGVILRGDFGIFPADVDTIVSFPGAFAMLGGYEADDVRKAMNEDDRVSGEELEYEAWEVSESRLGGQLTSQLTVALVHDEVYATGVDFEDSQKLFDAVARGDTLWDAQDNPLTRVMEQAGTGWLVGAWEGPWYCERRMVPSAFSGCLAMALAASTGDDSMVEVNWVILFDSEEAARAAGQVTLEEIAETHLILGEVGAVPELETDGEFVVVKATVTAEKAADLMSSWVGEMWGRW